LFNRLIRTEAKGCVNKAWAQVVTPESYRSSEQVLDGRAGSGFHQLLDQAEMVSLTAPKHVQAARNVRF
jgi:hypothetical protein